MQTFVCRENVTIYQVTHTGRVRRSSCRRGDCWEFPLSELALPSCELSSKFPFSGTLAILPDSFALVRVDPGVVVLLRVGIFCCAWIVSEVVSSTGWGFLACEMANGPAQRGKKGAATPASTKLANTVTGNIFSLIFSFPAGSAPPKTMCWTLL